MMRKIKYIIYLAFLTSGILLGVFFCNFSYFSFEKTIKFTDLVSILITSFLGIYIATSVNKGFARNSSEKELLINEIKSTIKILDKLIESIGSNKLAFGATVKAFKKINENLIMLGKLIKSSHCSELDLADIFADLQDLRRSITKISPINGYIVLDATTFRRVQPIAVELKTKLYSLIFDINKI